MEKANKVMIIDDDQTFIVPLEYGLKKRGIEVFSFTNPEEAIEYLKNNTIDLVLTDYHMEPNINGDEVIRRIREFNKDIPVYLETAYAEDLPAEEMLDSYEIQGYIDKGEGQNKNIQLVKAGLKQAQLINVVKEQEKEISRLSYKKAILGDLIANLVNEAKDQLMTIGGMAAAIENDTNDFEVEINGIKNATDKTFRLYEVLNFESLDEVKLEKLRVVISTLLKPTMVLNSARLDIQVLSENDVVEENVADLVYSILKIVEILISKGLKEITIELEKNNVEIKAENDFSISKEEFTMINDKFTYKINGNILEINL